MFSNNSDAISFYALVANAGENSLNSLRTGTNIVGSLIEEGKRGKVHIIEQEREKLSPHRLKPTPQPGNSLPAPQFLSKPAVDPGPGKCAAPMKSLTATTRQRKEALESLGYTTLFQARCSWMLVDQAAIGRDGLVSQVELERRRALVDQAAIGRDGLVSRIELERIAMNDKGTSKATKRGQDEVASTLTSTSTSTHQRCAGFLEKESASPSKRRRSSIILQRPKSEKVSPKAPKVAASTSHRNPAKWVNVSSVPNASSASSSSKADSERQQQPRLQVDHTYIDRSCELDPYPQSPLAHYNKYQRGKNNGGVVIPFPVRLHHMLDTCERDGVFQDVVSWRPHGRCFVVKHPRWFVEKVLPAYFQQTRLPSFQRQLNLYGFRRITRGKDRGAYYHELLLRGKRFLTWRMTRKKIKGTGGKPLPRPDTEPRFYDMPPMPTLDAVASTTDDVVDDLLDLDARKKQEGGKLKKDSEKLRENANQLKEESVGSHCSINAVQLKDPRAFAA